MIGPLPSTLSFPVQLGQVGREARRSPDQHGARQLKVAAHAVPKPCTIILRRKISGKNVILVTKRDRQ